MTADIPALSIRQPWASAIVLGGKDIENRSWSTDYRGPLLIHAAKSFDADDVDDVLTICSRAGLSTDWIDDPFGGPLGGIIGRTELVACVARSASPWFFGRYGFVLRDVRPLDFRPCRGHLGLFVPDYTPAPPKAPKAPKEPPRQRGLFDEAGR